MATNFVQEGNTVTLTAPHDVVSGDGVLVGGFFGIALSDVTSGEQGEFALVGVWHLAAVTTETFTPGAAVYWDDGVKKASSGSTGNAAIGAALAVKINGATTVCVRLNGVAV